MVEIYAVSINENIDENMFCKLVSLLPLEKQERISRFRIREDAIRSLVGDILVRTVICRRLRIKNSDITLSKNEYGKPFLKDRKDCHFNLSHSGKWVVCAVDNRPVGIDVEKVNKVDLNIARRFFTSEEYDDLKSMKAEEQALYFFDLWTLKESYIKAAGGGLSIPLDSFSFKIANGNIIMSTDNEFKDCYFKQYFIDTGYKMSVCSWGKEFPNTVNIKTIFELCKEALEM